jgi:hypothetical protein
MNLSEKKLYHQIHPLKLGTDISAAVASYHYLWMHQVGPAIAVAFLPPIIVSAAMFLWTPDLERLKQSPFGHYIRRSMTPAIEFWRLLTLIPMAYGAWVHDHRYAVLGTILLLLAWSNGLYWKRMPELAVSRRPN